MSQKLQWHHPGGKLRELGAESISDAELLAILISSGVKDRPAAEIAEDILVRFSSFKGMTNQPLSKFLEIKGTKLLKYIQDGERKGFHTGPTCASRGRESWYCLGKDWAYAPLIFPAKVGERMPIFLNDNVFEDKKLYGVIPKKPKDKLILAALLNSTVSRLFIEFTCRQLTGAQAIADIDVIVVENLSVLDPAKLSSEMRVALEESFDRLSKVSCESIFSELATSPSEVSLDKVKPDRRELDKIVMGDILGLSDDEQLEVYRAVVDLVKSRIEKAKSFGKRGKTKEGLDIELFIKTVMDKVGEDTLGKFYQEKILSHKPLSTRSLPRVSGEAKIEPELFGWRLSSGRQHIDCASEYEARYLKVWLEAGLDSVRMPKDEDYLEEIVPRLEELKEKIDDTFQTYLSSIVTPKLQQRVRHHLWQEAIK